jgi:hypothetical protein
MSNRCGRKQFWTSGKENGENHVKPVRIAVSRLRYETRISRT